MGKTFAILISTKNRKSDLLLTLEKISGLSRDNVECVVYDDGSTDGTFEAVSSQFPQVTLHRNEVSKGYIFCRNRMLNNTQATFAISLDDDAHFLSENPLAEIEKHFASNPKCGLIAFRIFWGKSVSEITKTKQEIQRVKGFVGCGHAWRMEAWHMILPYPEWFGFYGEESFAALELFQKSWEVHYLPNILVHHRVDMKARRKMKEFSFRYRRALRADWHLYFLYYPMSKIPRKMAYSLLMQLKKIAAGDFRIAIPLFRAILDVFAAIPKYIRRRNALSGKAYAEYSQLNNTQIYWKPENE